MSKTYFSYIPSAAGSIEEELKNCIEQAYITHQSGLFPVKFDVFLDVPDFDSVYLTRKYVLNTIAGLFGDKIPAVNVSAHPPARPWKAALEACFVSPSLNVSYRKFEEFPYVVTGSGDFRELWAAGLSSYRHSQNTRLAATEAFEKMTGLLAGEQMTLNNIVRQWNYIGKILSVSNNLQNYQVFNEVRSEYYHKYRTISSFPAATGVGMKHGGVILECIARDSKTSIIKPVDNPNQVNAYNYSQQVLKGKAEKGKHQKHPPQFERALIVGGTAENNTLYVSGTASIIGQETMGRNDAVEQTYVTIENINKLADPEHLLTIIGTEKACNVKFSVIRTYVKNQSDFDAAEKICSRHFPGVPSVFIEADICRDDLLIEIEAEAEIR